MVWLMPNALCSVANLVSAICQDELLCKQEFCSMNIAFKSFNLLIRLKIETIAYQFISAAQWHSHRGDGLGVRIPVCGKCDAIFSYIYANTTKLVLYLSYLVRLDCFSNAFS